MRFSLAQSLILVTYLLALSPTAVEAEKGIHPRISRSHRHIARTEVAKSPANHVPANVRPHIKGISTKGPKVVKEAKEHDHVPNTHLPKKEVAAEKSKKIKEHGHVPHAHLPKKGVAVKELKEHARPAGVSLPKKGIAAEESKDRAHLHDTALAAPEKFKACKRKPGSSKLLKRTSSEDSEDDCEFDRDRIKPLRNQNSRTARENPNRYTVTGRTKLYTDSLQGEPWNDRIHRDIAERYGRVQRDHNDRLARSGKPWSAREPPVIDVSAEPYGEGVRKLRFAQNQVAKKGVRNPDSPPHMHANLRNMRYGAGANRAHGNRMGMHAEEINANERSYDDLPAWDEDVSDAAVRVRRKQDVAGVRACESNCGPLQRIGGGRDVFAGASKVGPPPRRARESTAGSRRRRQQKTQRTAISDDDDDQILTGLDFGSSMTDRPRSRARPMFPTDDSSLARSMGRLSTSGRPAQRGAYGGLEDDEDEFNAFSASGLGRADSRRRQSRQGMDDLDSYGLGRPSSSRRQPQRQSLYGDDDDEDLFGGGRRRLLDDDDDDLTGYRPSTGGSSSSRRRPQRGSRRDDDDPLSRPV